MTREAPLDPDLLGELNGLVMKIQSASMTLYHIANMYIAIACTRRTLARIDFRGIETLLQSN